MDVEQLRLLAQLRVQSAEEVRSVHATDDDVRPHAPHEEHADEGAEKEARGDTDEDERGPAGGLEDGGEARVLRRAWGSRRGA